MNLTGVILDLDGVLIDTESISKRAWTQAATEFDFEISDTMYSSIVGHSVKSARIKIEAFTDGTVDMDAYMERAAAIYLGELYANGVRTQPGVHELFEFLDRNQLKTAIATSTIKQHAEWKLESAGLHGIVEDVITGDQTERGKPAPDLFLLAADAIAIDPVECVVVEDAEAGIIGASAAGMTPIMVPSTASPTVTTEQLAHSIVPTLYDVVRVLRQWV